MEIFLKEILRYICFRESHILYRHREYLMSHRKSWGGRMCKRFQKRKSNKKQFATLFFSDNTISVLQKSSKINSGTRCKRKEAWKSLKCSVRSFRMKKHVPKSLVRDRITSEKITRVLTLYLPIVQYLFARHKVHILCNCQHYSDT